MFALFMAVMLGFANIDVWAATISSNGTGGGSWNTGSSWAGGVVPTSADNVNIVSGDIVIVNTNPQVVNLTVTNGTLKPDVGTRTMTVDNDLTLVAGSIDYINTTGTLSWIFTGASDGNSAIDNQLDAYASMKFFNVTISGSTTSVSAVGSEFTVYGNFAVTTGSFLATEGTVYFSNTSAKTISNSSSAIFKRIRTIAGAAVSTASDITISTLLYTEATSAFTVNSPAIITTGTLDIYSLGTLTFDSGSSLVSAGTVSINASGNDITGFSGAFTLSAANTLTLGTKTISGTGSFTSGAASTLSLSNTGGVSSALNLTGTRSFSSSMNVTFSGTSTTGFTYSSGNNVTSVGNFTHTGNVTSTETFTVTGILDGLGSFTASAGTVTLSTGGTSLGATGGAQTFYNLALTHTAGTTTLAHAITVSGGLSNVAGGTLQFGAFQVTMNGTGTLDLAGTATESGVGGITINTTGTITNNTSFTLTATGAFTLTAGTLDMKSTAITSGKVSGVTLSAGTIRTSIATGFIGSFPNPVNLYVNVTSGINFDFYGDNTQTTFGFFSPGGFTYGGTATGGTLFQIISIGNLTITGGASTALSPAIASFGTTFVLAQGSLTVAGNFTATGYAVMTIPYHLTNNPMIISGTRSISIASTSAIQFNYLSIATGGIVTTTSNFTVVGILTTTGTGSLVCSTPSVVTYASGAAQVAPVNNGTLTFYDLAVTGAGNSLAPATSFTIAGNLVITGTSTIAATANVITMSGTSKNIYLQTGATAPTFFGLTLTGSITAPAASASQVVAAGQTMATTAVSNFSILTGGTLTVSTGSLTCGDLQTTTFAGTGTLAGAGSKSFYDLAYSNVIACAVPLTVRNDVNGTTGAAAWTQSASTFTMTAADGAATINTVAVTSLVLNTGELALAPSASSGTYSIGATNGITATGVGQVFVYSNATLSINGTLQPTITGTGVFRTGSGAQVEYGTGANFGLATTINTTTKTIHANTDLVIGSACLTTAGLTAGAIQTWRNVQIKSTALITLGGNTTVSGNFQTTAAGSYDETLTPTIVVTMTGTSKSIINGNTNLVFGKLVINTGATITSSTNFRVSNATATALDVQGTGSLICSAGVFGLAGAAANTPGITVASTGVLTFYDLTVDPAGLGIDATVAASSPFTVSHDLTNGLATSSLTANASSSITLSGTGTVTPLVDVASGTAGFQFGNVYVSGTKTQTGAFIVDVIGSDFNVTSTGNFTAGAGTINLNSASASSTITITNAGTLVFNNLTTGNAAANVYTSASDFTVAGNLTLDALDTYWHTAGTINVSGAASIITVGATANPATPIGMILKNLTIKSTATGATLTDGAGGWVVDLRGDLTVEAGGSLVCTATSTQNFTTGTTKTITNNGTLTFGIFSIANVASNSVITASDFTVAGTGAGIGMKNVGSTGGTFVASAGTVTLSGAAGDVTNNGASASAMTFYSLNFTGAANTLDQAAGGKELYVKGNLTFANATSFVAGTGSKIWLNGTTEQVVTVGVGTVDLENLTVNNSNGAKLNSTNTNVTAGQLTFNKTLRLQSGDFDLNGNNIVEIASTAGLLSETPGNTVKNTGVVSSTGYIYITNGAPGVLAANNLGGLGAQISTAIDPTSITIKRYHIAQTVGTSTGLSRYYEIATTVTTGLNSTLTMKYDDSELGSLTEANLAIVNASAAAGPWNYVTYSSKDVTNNYIRVTGIDGYSGVNSFWTSASPSVVTLSALTNGLETTPLTAGTLAKAIGGIQLSANGTVTANTIKFNFSRALAASEFSNFKLYYSSDNDYSTTTDNTLVTATTAGGGIADSYITFTMTDNNSLSNGSPKNYFLVADVASGVTAATTVITLSQTNADVTVTDGVVKTATLTGSSFLFQPALMMEALNKGITASPIIASTTNNAIIGFSISGTSAANFTGFTVATSTDPTSTLENIKLYSSTDNDYSTSADNSQITLLSSTASSTGYVLTFAAQTVLTTPKYYFIVTGVKNAVLSSATAIQPSIAHSSFVSATAGKRLTKTDGSTASTSISGFNYEFVKNGATVTASQPAAGNLSRSVRDLPVYGFTVTPDNSSTVAFTAVAVDATFGNSATSADVTSYKLAYDANGNGMLDAGEQIAVGVYTAGATTGNLVFSTFTSAQSFSSARKYLVTVNVSSSATSAGTLVVSMASERNITATSPTKIAAFGPFTGNTHTFRTPGVATKLAIIGRTANTITTGGTVGYTVQAQDANSYPANVAANQTVTIANPATATLGGTTTGIITTGTNFVTISPTLTIAAGATSESVNATGSSLTASANSTGLKILVAEPTTTSTNVVLGTPLVTTIPVTSSAGGNGAGRMIVIRQGLPPVAPTDGTSYTAFTNIKDATAGSQTGPDSYVVYNSSSAVSSFNVTGLTPGVEYFLQVFEYNGTAGSGLENYIATDSYTSSTVQNPKSASTPSGSLGTIASAITAASISNDVNVSGAVSAASDTLYYQFVVNTNKRNVMVRLSGLPKNYTLELYDATAGVSGMTLIRQSKVLSTGTETAILNNATAGKYIIKVYSADGTYSATNYTVKVTTSSTELMSQPN